MNDILNQLLFDGVIDEVVSRLKSGKEADVYLVHHEGELVAAKIYKERATRSFKNNAGYVEGRKVRNSRTQRAIDKGSRFGQEAAEDAWKSAEADSLYRLHAAGVRVPTPKLFYEGVLLMELIAGADGQAAPRLIECQIEADEAASMYEDLRGQIVKMLCCDLIHGDLSPYNILLAPSGPTIIDFPQTIAAATNNQAAFYFKRDFDNVRAFLGSFDRRLRKRGTDADEIWAAYERRELTPDFVPTGHYEPPKRAVTAASTLEEMLRELADEAREAQRMGRRGQQGGRKRGAGGQQSGGDSSAPRSTASSPGSGAGSAPGPEAADHHAGPDGSADSLELQQAAASSSGKGGLPRGERAGSGGDRGRRDGQQGERQGAAGGRGRRDSQQGERQGAGGERGRRDSQQGERQGAAGDRGRRDSQQGERQGAGGDRGRRDFQQGERQGAGGDRGRRDFQQGERQGAGGDRGRRDFQQGERQGPAGGRGRRDSQQGERQGSTGDRGRRDSQQGERQGAGGERGRRGSPAGDRPPPRREEARPRRESSPVVVHVRRLGPPA